jgi:LmbE family N-acetylglucosaminyl deacetylase
VEGIVAARDPHFFPEQGMPHHRPDALLLFEADEPDHVEDVGGFAEAKLAALHAHNSQLRSTMGIDESASLHDVERQRQAFDDRILAALADHGTQAGVAQGEAFKLLTDL